jgi:hypothetical protein
VFWAYLAHEAKDCQQRAFTAIEAQSCKRARLACPRYRRCQEALGLGPIGRCATEIGLAVKWRKSADESLPTLARGGSGRPGTIGPATAALVLTHAIASRFFATTSSARMR